jgi:glycyl-tRNA synthetase beta chain
MDLVAQGHEKVLRARLSDAKFFYETDCEFTLDQFAEKLKKVTFQEKLGSVHDKVKQILSLVAYLVDVCAYPDPETLRRKVTRAARICKADLVSQVVIEFTKLQGTIGRAYALNQGEDPEVADAIEQHYRPVHSGAVLPENPTAVILAIADKLSTICGCFSVGLIPTGGADPYALRRLGIGIIQIIQDQNLQISLTDLIQQGVAGYISDPDQARQTAARVKTFFQNRMVNIMTDQGFSKEAVNSALAADFDNLPDVRLRIRALDALRSQPGFEPLAVTFKRVENILKKAESGSGTAVDPGLFEDESETRLAQACTDVAARADALAQSGDYPGALKEIATLRPDVDLFFDNVMVFADDRAVQANRIALLASVSDLFNHIADFSVL